MLFATITKPSRRRPAAGITIDYAPADYLGEMGGFSNSANDTDEPEYAKWWIDSRDASYKRDARLDSPLRMFWWGWTVYSVRAVRARGGAYAAGSPTRQRMSADDKRLSWCCDPVLWCRRCAHHCVDCRHLVCRSPYLDPASTEECCAD